MVQFFREHRLTVIFFILFSFFSSVVTWNIYAQLNNTLKNNGQWDSTKLHLAMYVVNSEEFVKSRPTLAFSHLNLGAWSGFQEVLTLGQYPLAISDFDFSFSEDTLTEDTYFYFVFNKNFDQFSAVRLSNSTEYPSSYVTVKESGEFMSIIPFEVPKFLPKTWYHVRFIFDSQNRSVAVEIDYKRIAVFNVNLPNNQSFGFRGSAKKVLIDNVTVRDNKNNLIFIDNFDYHDKRMIEKWIGIFFLVSLLEGMVFLSIVLLKKSKQYAILLSLIFSFWLLVSLLCVEGFLWFFYLNSYPNQNSVWKKFMSKIVLQKQTTSADWYDIHNQELISKYHLDRSKKILFIGSSQTWGAGAEREDETYVNIFANETKFKDLPSSNIALAPTNVSSVLGLTDLSMQSATSSVRLDEYQVINAGMSALTSTELLRYYETIWINFSPKIVIIDLSTNDWKQPETFKTNLMEFARFNKERGIATVFVLEPNSTEIIPGEPPLATIMRGVAEHNSIRMIDLHEYLKTKKDTGVLWWDLVHPTSYGHNLIGKFLFDSVKDML